MNCIAVAGSLAGTLKLPCATVLLLLPVVLVIFAGPLADCSLLLEALLLLPNALLLLLTSLDNISDPSSELCTTEPNPAKATRHKHAGHWRCEHARVAVLLLTGLKRL
jgi:hypothetical protein